MTNKTLKVLGILALFAVTANSFAVDYDGDKRADISYRNPQTFEQIIRNSSDGELRSLFFGRDSGDVPIQGDFDGDGINDIGVRRASNKTWYILNSSGVDTITNNSDGITRRQFGLQLDDIPVAADYDGDGKTDIAFRRPATQTWYILNSSGQDNLTGNSDGITRRRFGLQSTDIPTVADFDGDGKADIAVRRPATQQWFILNSSGVDPINNYADGISRVRFGLQQNDIPVPADYDGDGKADIAVRRGSSFYWYVRNSAGSDLISNNTDGITRKKFGLNESDLPVPADYDGDGKTDLAVYRPSNSTWYILNSNGVDLIGNYRDGISRVNLGSIPGMIPLGQPAGVLWNNSDIDQDGLTNAQELVYGSNIILADTDGDGISDGEEVNTYGTSATNSDSDNDGVSDGDEILAGSDPNDATSLLASPLSELTFTDPNLENCITSYIYANGNVRANMVKSLQCETFYSNSLRSLEGIEQLSGLETLVVSSNAISDLTPLASLEHLSQLNLNYNLVNDLSPLSSITSLTELFLENNPITDFSPLHTLPNLARLHVGSNELSDITSIGQLQHVTTISINASNVTDLTPLSAMPALTNLSLFAIELTDLAALTPLTELTELNIERSIEDISQLPTFSKLESLSLNTSMLDNIEPIAELSDLQQLSLHGSNTLDMTPLLQLNQLNTLISSLPNIDISFLAELTSLTSLQLDGDRVADFSVLASLTELTSLKITSYNDFNVSHLSNLTKLTVLSLSGSNISDISPLAGLTRLQSLRLSGAPLSDITVLSNFTDLQTLVLNNNQIVDISPLASLSSLSSVFLENNQIVDISPLANLNKVHDLRLTGNSITQLPDLSGMTELYLMTLKSNQLSDISGIASAPRLGVIFADNNQISDISMLANMEQMISLSLGNNQIADLSALSGMDDMIELDINNNLISDLTPLEVLPKLQTLNLNNNAIANLSALQELTRLTSLNLSTNSITDLSPLSNMSSLVVLWVYDNPELDCDSLSSLKQVLADTQIRENTSCNFPDDNSNDSELVIFADEENPQWPLWDCCGGTTPEVVTDDEDHGAVAEFKILDNNGTVMGFNGRNHGGQFDASAMVGHGTLRFEMKVVEAPTRDTNWLVQVNSNDSDFVELHLTASNEGVAPVVGQWQTYTFDLSTLVSAGLAPNSIDAILVFPEWQTGEGAVYRIDNVKISGESTEQPAALDIFIDEAKPQWPLWDCCGGTPPEVVTDDETLGGVAQFEILDNNGTVMGFNGRSAGSRYNATSLISQGVFQFDMKIVNAPSADTSWLLKIESNGSGSDGFAELLLSSSIEGQEPSLGEWQTYTFTVQNLVDAGLNPSGIDMILIFPAWATGEGAVYRIDNVKFFIPE